MQQNIGRPLRCLCFVCVGGGGRRHRLFFTENRLHEKGKLLFFLSFFLFSLFSYIWYLPCGCTIPYHSRQLTGNMTNETNNESSPSQYSAQKNSQLTPEQRKEELTKCLLSQYRLCAAGTIGGAGFSVLRSQSARPTAWPMLGGAVSASVSASI